MSTNKQTGKTVGKVIAYIRAYYAKKSKADGLSQDCEEQRKRYMKVMAEDFPKDFISDDEWDYIEAMASWSKK